MEFNEFIKLFEEAVRVKETIVFSADCSVNYSGRAESYLPDGERIIIIKSDSNLLVHQPKGTAPVNYMKQGSVHSIAENDEGVIIFSRNNLLKESMEIKLNKVHFLKTVKLNDNAALELAGSERDMADMIAKNPELIEKGFKPVSREEQTKYGFIDLLGMDAANNLVVIECKRYCADLQAVTQLRRYVEKMISLKGIKNVRGILAAPKITQNAEHMLKDWGFRFRKVEPPSYLERHRKKQKKLGEFSHKLIP